MNAEDPNPYKPPNIEEELKKEPTVRTSTERELNLMTRFFLGVLGVILIIFSIVHLGYAVRSRSMILALFCGFIGVQFLYTMVTGNWPFVSLTSDE